MTGKDEKEKSECSESSGFTKISQLNLFKKEDLSGPPLSAHPHRYKRKLSRKASEVLKRSCLAHIRESYRGDPAEGNMVLQPDIYDTEETRRPPISFKQPLLPVPSIAIGAIAEPVRLHEDPPHSSRMGQIERNSSLGIPRISDDYGKDIFSLPQDQNQHKCDLSAIRSKPRRLKAQTDWYLSQKTFSEAGSKLYLIYVQLSAWSECSDKQVDKIQQSVLLPKQEPDSPGGLRGTLREGRYDSSDSNVEIFDLVSKTDGTISFTAISYSRNKCSTKFKKQKVTALRKQELELDGLEDHRRFLEALGLGH
ncbi:hypothetical protein AYI70_g10730 [Smittium culicis]|uniref:Uncharacterized protein n=1 Tax=Smittium culicis TaxID=133412 RepID=A0A1R1X5D3_9FUNG|nr:hypothetical protein AYI70_g10730 [Smittium culicis]